jgi:cysteine synthase A
MASKGGTNAVGGGLGLEHFRHNRRLRVRSRGWPETKIVLCEPANAQLLGSGKPQERRGEHAPAASHSSWEPHPIQGWTPDFIPWVLQEALDKKLYDEVIPIPGPEGIQWSRKLAQSEGILTGISGGATFGVAMQVAARASEGAVILCVLPDTGERYLSSPLFEGIPEDMSPEEVALSKSTPNFQIP